MIILPKKGKILTIKQEGVGIRSKSLRNGEKRKKAILKPNIW
jgi:hypothetical protein